MKAKDFFALIDAVREDEIRADSVMYRNAFEAILALKEGEQLDVFRWFFAYSLYGIEPIFDEKLIKNRKNKASIEFIFSLLKKQRIGWEKSKIQQNRHNDPMGGALGGTPTPTLSHTRDKQVSKDTSISDDIQVPDGTSSKSKKEKAFEGFGEDWIKLFNEWLEYKAAKKQTYKTEKSLRAMADQLYKLASGDIETARKIVNQSLANNWNGLFELKTVKPSEPDHYKGDDTIGKNFVRRGID